MPRLFVTGASGALGGALLRHLGAAATGVSRSQAPKRCLSRWRFASLPEADWLEDPKAVIVHAAAVSSAGANDSAEAMAAPHLVFADALIAAGFQGRLIFLSSAAVYGEATRLPIPETAPVRPLNAYGVHKALVEAGLADRAGRAGFGLTILRLANIYGTALDLSRRRVGALILDALARGEPFVTYGTGTTQRDYLHVDDFCRAVARAVAKAPEDTVLNLGSGTGTSLQTLIASAEAATGRTMQVRREATRAEADASFLDIARARRALDWAPAITVEAGLRKLVAVMAAG